MKLRIYIKHMKAEECRIPKSNRYELHALTNYIETYPGHILYTISRIIIIPCMQLLV